MATTITVQGMTCGHCEQKVVDALLGVAGVADAAADREVDTATVEGEADVDALIAAVENAGYEASA